MWKGFVMTAVELFDGSSCCGPARPAGEQGSAADFAGSAAWLGARGVHVASYSLSADPAVFAGNATVAGMIDAEGMGVLPVVLVDGTVRASGRYPTRDELAAWCEVGAEPAVQA